MIEIWDQNTWVCTMQLLCIKCTMYYYSEWIFWQKNSCTLFYQFVQKSHKKVLALQFADVTHPVYKLILEKT